MNSIRAIPRAALLRYALLNAAGLAVLALALIAARRWFALPAWLFWTILALAVVKDIVLFPFVWRAYEGSSPCRVQALIGQRGVVVEPLAPAGYIRLRGELWQAEAVAGCEPIAAGEPVEVERAEGLKVFVAPAAASTD